ncbi:MAG: cell wall-binding repeat-containing protein [Peptostreptococcus sp.]|uniref:cell wall-binding repeat-containing protein n=1 Tax=Peptostreptococcus sp. TaxID=1262 RepID=UPI002FCBB959
MKKLIAISMGIIFFMSSISGVKADEKQDQVPKQNISVSRVSGWDRYETAVNANKKYMNQANGNLAVIASGNDFKTALYASYMASALKVPYFVNPSHGMRSDILNELNRLKVKRVYVLGDYSKLDKSIDNTLLSRGIRVERIDDNNKYCNIHGSCDEMSLDGYIDTVIFETLHKGENRGDIGNVIYINDNKFPDLLSAVPFVAKTSAVQATALFGIDDLSDMWLGENEYAVFSNRFIIGGYESVPEEYRVRDYFYGAEFENRLMVDDEETYEPYRTWGRISGKNRYQTAVEIAKAYKIVLHQDINTVVLVNGQDYPDALSSSLIASQNNAAVLLTEPNKLNEDTEKYIRENNIKNVIIVGGERSVSKDVENKLKNFN